MGHVPPWPSDVILLVTPFDCIVLVITCLRGRDTATNERSRQTATSGQQYNAAAEKAGRGRHDSMCDHATGMAHPAPRARGTDPRSSSPTHTRVLPRLPLCALQPAHGCLRARAGSPFPLPRHLRLRILLVETTAHTQSLACPEDSHPSPKDQETCEQQRVRLGVLVRGGGQAEKRRVGRVYLSFRQITFYVGIPACQSACQGVVVDRGRVSRGLLC